MAAVSRVCLVSDDAPAPFGPPEWASPVLWTASTTAGKRSVGGATDLTVWSDVVVVVEDGRFSVGLSLAI